MALVQACLKHLSEQQMKILRAMVVRQSYTLDRLDWRTTVKKCLKLFYYLTHVGIK